MPKHVDVVCFPKSDVLRVLSEIETLLISLRNMGNLYLEMGSQTYEHETTKFIDEWRVTHRLAGIRQILSEPFGAELGADNMGELERAMMDVRAWGRPGDKPD